MINRKLVLIIVLAAVLRFWHLSQTPPSLYWDEVSLGYNAYSILKTARDEHGKFLPLTNFGAFGDYKPPAYIYATVPSVAVFGLNEFAVRFPSALFGTLTILLAYFLAKILLSKKSDATGEKAALVCAFFLAISPWHIHLSRAAFEANLGLFFSTLGILAFFKFALKNPFYLFLSMLAFGLAMYTFTGQRLFVPFMVLALAIVFWRQLLNKFKYVVAAGLIAVIIFWPLFNFSTRTIEGKLRFNEVTIFKNLDPINKSIEYRHQDNFSAISALIHNRRLFYAQDYLTHYFDALNPSFLFTKGDVNPRLSTQEIGELYYFDFILIPVGVFFLFAKKYHFAPFIIAWLLVSALGPATARETPHALRMIHILPTFQLIASAATVNLLQILNKKKIILWLFATIIAASSTYYLYIYYIHWPETYSGEWQYGYRQAVEQVKEHLESVNHVFVTESHGRPYIYFLFYNQFDPKIYQQTARVKRDQFFFYHVEGFDKFTFGVSEESLPILPRSLYVLPPNQLPKEAKKITTIYNLSGNKVFEIGEID